MTKTLSLLAPALTAFAPLASAQDTSPGGGGGGFQLLIILLMFGGMYFLIIAPQRKRQKQHEQLIAALKPGDRIVTAGGIHGQITNVKDDRVTVRVCDEVKMDFSKSSVTTKLGSEGTDEG